jgi:hypothetical protein
LPSVLIGAAGVPVYFLFCRRFFGLTIAAIAAVLLTLWANHIYWSREAKPEVLVMLLVIPVYWSALELAGRPPFYRRALGPVFVFALSAVATLYTHNTGVFVLIVAGLIYLTRRIAERTLTVSSLLFWALLNAVVLAAYAPWLSIVLDVTGNRTGYYWLKPVTPRDAADAIAFFYSFPGAAHKSSMIFWGALLLLSAGFIVAIRSGAKSLAVAVPLLVYPFILFGICLLVPVFLQQSIVLYMQPIQLLVYAFGIEKLISIKWARPAIVAIVAMLALSVGHIYRATKEPWNQVAAYLKDKRTAGQPLLFWPAYAEWSVRYYMPPASPGDAAEWANVDSTDGRVEFRPFKATRVVQPDEVPAFLGAADVVWLVEDRKEIGWSDARENQLAALYPNRERKDFPLDLFVERFSR